MGRSRFFGAAVSGVLKGCAAEVDVAAGLSLGRGFVAVVVCAVTACALGEADAVKEREAMEEIVDDGLCRARRRIHRWQIIVAR